MTHSLDERRWSVEVYHVMNRDRQQRILEAFRDIARPDVTALGTQSGSDWFVVIETNCWNDAFFSRSTIEALDAHAVRAYSYKASPVIGPMLA